MKQKISFAVFVLSLILNIGIIGGVECGEPLSNLWWCVPLFLVTAVSAVAIELS